MNYAKLVLDVGRNRIARDRLKRKEPHSFLAECFLGYTVLVHRSTKRAGWWQASIFDADGEPVGDRENADWAALLDHIHGDEVQWRTVRSPR